MRSARRRLRTAVSAVCVLALAGCSGGSSSAAQVSFAPQHRKAAPNLSGTTLKDGTAFSLAAERGHVVVVNFWASWCEPCLAETPYLDQVYQDTSGDGVTFIGISYHGDAKSDAEHFLASHQVPYDSLYDPNSKTVLQLAGKVAVQAPPLTMVIDKQGRIATIVNGEVSYTDLLKAVRAANAEAPA